MARIPSSSKKQTRLKDLSEWKPLYNEDKRPNLSNTPYRLPRIDGMPADSVYSRHGFIFKARPPPSAGFYSRRISPLRYSKRFNGPTFRKVMIAPTLNPRLIAADHSDPLFKSLLRHKTIHKNTAHPEIDPTPTPRPVTPYNHGHHGAQTRSLPPPDIPSIEWVMAPQRQGVVDRKGHQHNQGPFSREFTVHCTAPTNWMKMKWGMTHRSNTRDTFTTLSDSNYLSAT